MSLLLSGRSTDFTMIRIASILLVIQFVFLLGVQTSNALKYKDFNERGSVKNAWPEFAGGNVDEVVKAIESQGVRVRTEAPRDGGSPPFDGGKPEDVWVYTDGNDRVVGIPQRGPYHFNRVNPGWRELVGIAFQKAIEAITAEQLGVTVVYGPKGFPRTKDYRLDRVFLDVDKLGNVAVTPKLG